MTDFSQGGPLGIRKAQPSLDLHEKKWRVVLVGAIGYVSLPPAMVDAVVLGMRTESKTEAVIRGWLKDRVPPVKLLRVVHRPKSFILELVSA
jgi:hypothetical protein